MEINEQPITNVSRKPTSSYTFHNKLVLAKYRDHVDLQIDLNASLHRTTRAVGEKRFVAIEEDAIVGLGVRAFGLNLTASSTIITSTRSAQFTYYVDDSAVGLRVKDWYRRLKLTGRMAEA